MECNCIENKTFQADIRHVYGNVLRLAIPLTLRTLEKVGDEIVATDTDFIPSSDYPVTVEFSKGAIKLAFNAVMRDGNVAYIEDDGTIPVGVYAITVLCKDGNGRPYRFKQKSVLQVVEYTAEAGIEETIEYEVTTWYLDAAIFMALKGEDGVGVEDIVTESSGEIGGVNTVTIILTDGRTKEFTILNGSGSVDMNFDAESHHPVANSTVTAKFDEIDGELADLFGDVEYDSSGKTIKFYNKGKNRVLASLSAVPFVKDGMVSNVYISNNTLVITFNTDSGREAIGVPLTSVFNPNNYYNKTQVDNRIAAAVANVQIDTSTLLAKSEYTIEEHPQSSSISGRLKYLKIPPTALKYIEGVGMEDSLDGGDVFARENGHLYEASYFGSTYDLGTVTDRAFLNKADGLFYRYIINEGWVQVGGSSSSGGDSSVVYGLRSSTGFKQGTLINGSWIYSTLDIDLDVKTIYFDVTTRKAYTWDGKDFQEFYSTSLANLADVAFSGSYNDLTDKPTIPESADLTGYATETYVDNAIAGLVDTAPQTLDTLNELAQALGDDPNFATTISTELGGKVDKETGKSLMTDAERTKLAGIASGAEVNVNADWNASSGDAQILNKPTIPSKTSDLTNDIGFVTSTTMATALAGKQDTLTFDNAPTAGSNNPVKSSGIKTYVDGKATITGITTNQDGAFTITLSDGNSFTVNLTHSHPLYLKYQLMVDEAAYNALSTKDSGTLYLIPES